MYMAEYEIKLGIGLNDTDFNAIKNKINSLKDETIKLKLDDSAVDTQIAGIKREIESLGKTKGLKFDTSTLENSLTSVKGDITEIKNLLNSLGNGANVKGLVSSINNIGTALDKVSGKFDELKVDLSALSKKDFGINLDIKLGGGNTPTRSADYGAYVRQEVLPELTRQEQAITKALAEYYKTNELQGTLKLYQSSGRNNTFQDVWGMLDSLQTPIKKGENISDKLTQFKVFFKEINSMAKMQGIDLSSVWSQFDKLPDELIKSANDIRDGTTQVKNNFEELQKVFSSGIDGEKLSTQLDSIVTDLNEIKTAIQGLSSGVTLDGLLQSFDRLSNSIKELMTNARNIQDVLLNIGSSAGASNNLNNAIQTLKSSEKVLDDFKASLKNLGMGDVEIDAVAERIKNLGVQINTLNQQKTLIPGKKRDKEILSVDISGLDKMGNAIKLTEQYDIATGKLIKSIDRVSTVQQKAGASANTFAKQQKIAVSNLTNQINQISRAANDQNANRPIKDTSHIDALKAKYNEIISAIQKMKNASSDTFTDEQNNVKKLISEYKSLVSEFRNAENVSIKMKGTDFKSGLDIARNDLAKFKADAKDFPKITNTIKELDTAINNVGDSASLNKFNDQLRIARSELAKVKSEISSANRNEKVGIKVSGLESQISDLQRISPEIDKFETKIAGADVSIQSLLADLRQVKTDGDFSVVNTKFKAFTDAAKASGIAIAETAAKAKSIGEIKIKLASGGFANQVDNIEARAKKLSNTYNEVEIGIKEVKQALADMGTAAANGDTENLIAANKRYEMALKSVRNQININARAEQQGINETALSTRKENALLRLKTMIGENSQAAKRFAVDIQNIQNEINECGSLSGFSNIDKKITNLGLKVKEANVQTKTFGQEMKEQFNRYKSYFSVVTVFMYASRAMRSMFEQVKSIDTAMTELKKVTDESGEAYDKFLKNAASRAKEIGTTIDGLVTSTADFARLGYSFDQAQGLAEVANIYTVVGDEIEGVEEATQSLVSTMAAFKDEMGNMSDSEFALSIVDKFNEVDILAS